MGVGRSIKAACTFQGMTLKDLAKKSGVSYRAITSIVARDSERISEETYKKIAPYLNAEGISLEEFKDYAKRYDLNGEDEFKTKYPLISHSLIIQGGSYKEEDDNSFITVDEGCWSITDEQLEALEKKISRLGYKTISDYVQSKGTNVDDVLNRNKNK